MSVRYHAYPEPPPPPPHWHHPVHPWADLQFFIATVLILISGTTLFLLYRYRRDLSQDERTLAFSTIAVQAMCTSVVINTERFGLWIQAVAVYAIMLNLALAKPNIRQTFLPWTK